METPVSIVTAEEVEDSLASALSSDHAAAPFSPPPTVYTPPDPKQQRPPEPEPERECEPELKLVAHPHAQVRQPQPRPLFSLPLQRPTEPLPVPTATTTAFGAAMAQEQAEWSQHQGAVLTPEEEAAKSEAAARREAEEKAAKELNLEKEREARRRADEYAAVVLPARAKYEAALQQLRQSEAATQERWGVRRQQDKDRLATERKAVLAAAEARRTQAQENERAVLALVDGMRPKVVAYKEQYAGWYQRTYGAPTARQPSQMRCVISHPSIQPFIFTLSLACSVAPCTPAPASSVPCATAKRQEWLVLTLLTLALAAGAATGAWLLVSRQL